MHSTRVDCIIDAHTHTEVISLYMGAIYFLLSVYLIGLHAHLPKYHTSVHTVLESVLQL